ncbi:MAG: SiaB family protein kinase [Bacteroidales bacterium]|nr:SiaB family protein kinase [Bacteroidales bacterium]
MKSYDVVVNHKGYISLDIIDDILHQLKTFLNNKEKQNKIIRKRVYSLGVECVDNIIKHSDLNEQNHQLLESYPPRFIVERIAGNYLIHTGNIILNENVELIINKLDGLNNLGENEVNELYKESLSNAEISEKGGAGLGLIVMSRITGHKIKYDFEKINDKFSYFAMQLNLKQ